MVRETMTQWIKMDPLNEIPVRERLVYIPESDLVPDLTADCLMQRWTLAT